MLHSILGRSANNRSGPVHTYANMVHQQNQQQWHERSKRKSPFQQHRLNNVASQTDQIDYEHASKDDDGDDDDDDISCNIGAMSSDEVLATSRRLCREYNECSRRQDGRSQELIDMVVRYGWLSDRQMRQLRQRHRQDEVERCRSCDRMWRFVNALTTYAWRNVKLYRTGVLALARFRSSVQYFRERLRYHCEQRRMLRDSRLV